VKFFKKSAMHKVCFISNAIAKFISNFRSPNFIVLGVECNECVNYVAEQNDVNQAAW
jgi:hypothetical protein